MAIKFKMEQMGINKTELAKLVGIPRDKISLYINHDHYDLRRGSVTQKQLVDICEVLGIKINLDIKFV